MNNIEEGLSLLKVIALGVLEYPSRPVLLFSHCWGAASVQTLVCALCSGYFQGLTSTLSCVNVWPTLVVRLVFIVPLMLHS